MALPLVGAVSVHVCSTLRITITCSYSRPSLCMVPDCRRQLGPFLQPSSSATRCPAPKSFLWSINSPFQSPLFGVPFVAFVSYELVGGLVVCDGVPCHVGFHRFYSANNLRQASPTPAVVKTELGWKKNPKCKAFWATFGQSQRVCIEALERVLEIFILWFWFSSFILRFFRYQLHSVGNTEKQRMYLYKINW